MLPLIALALGFSPYFVAGVDSQIDRGSYPQAVNQAIDFVRRYLLCATVDEDHIMDVIAAVRRTPDILAEECLDFTHDPRQVHVANGPDEIVIIDNGNVDSTHSVVPTLNVDAPHLDGMPLGEDLAMNEAENPEVVPEAPAAIEAVVPEVEVQPIPEGRATRNYTVCQDVVEVKNHRRVNWKLSGDYVPCVVSEIKNRLGVPKSNAANELAVRRMALQIMTKHGVRPTHIRMYIEVIIQGVFIPDEHDLLAAEMKASNTARNLHHQHQNAGPQSVWQRVGALFRRDRCRGLEERG